MHFIVKASAKEAARLQKQPCRNPLRSQARPQVRPQAATEKTSTLSQGSYCQKQSIEPVVDATSKLILFVAYFASGETIAMDDQALLDQLQTIVNEKTKLKIDKLEPSLNLETSGLDSMARVNLVLEIEEHFGFELTDSESASITTVADLLDQIKAKIAA